ncbi:hypothetical protein CAPTEDRAFT_203852 [Capitella teleta]|uniref:G-protein coupled receptors family 1 profile domain-containing protein n=1 Tax=Capitella teleta TaxID=283909 RepID=R7T5R4_CAPTE|nr:hypothetical protein CAPTEDRAFT_203852 [Capitella teleta]|eukprot:ELT88533.1 hypothetical protein CAPTEDRAFT_203852 [Capitella teleta]
MICEIKSYFLLRSYSTIKCYVALVGSGFIGRHWMFNVACKFVYFMYYVSFYCSILTMLTMGFERFLVICYPLRAVRLTSIGNMTRCAALIWLISMALASPTLYLYGIVNGAHCQIHKWELNKMFNIFMGCNVVAIFFIPAIILLFLYAKTIHTLHKSIGAALRMRAIR